jgi:hypothetical protein
MVVFVSASLMLTTGLDGYDKPGCVHSRESKSRIMASQVVVGLNYIFQNLCVFARLHI